VEGYIGSTSRAEVLAFGTHLSRYSLQATAGKFLENEEVTEQGLDYSAPDPAAHT
jgi:hypothetical protein